jgi:hypothetical protein
MVASSDHDQRVRGRGGSRESQQLIQCPRDGLGGTLVGPARLDRNQGTSTAVRGAGSSGENEGWRRVCQRSLTVTK